MRALLGVALLAAPLLVAPAARAGLVLDVSSYPVRSSMGALVATGDFDGDGRPDLVSVPRYGPDAPATILLGRGDGSFRSGLGPAASALSMATGDLNGDGRLDLALPSMTTATVLFGRGDGTFAAPVAVGGPNSGAPGGVSSVAIGQLGGPEPGLDLAVTTGNGLEVLLNKGDGTFAAPAVYPGWGASEIVLGDFTGDAHADVALTRFIGVATSAITVLPGSAAGTLGDPVETPVDRPLGSPVAYDDDGDGLLDILVADRSMYGSGIGLFYGVGDGSFELLAGTDVGAGSAALGVGDLNADDRPDAVAASYDNWLTTWFNDGSLADARYSDAAPDGALGMTVADFDGDGYDDVATSTWSGKVFVSRNAPGLATAPASALEVSAAAPQAVTVTNTGLPPLKLGAVAVTGDADFTAGGSCVGATVPAGGTCALAVAFTPRAAGRRAATLVINGNQAGGPKRLTLTGTGPATPPSQPAAPKDTTAPTLKTTVPRQRLAAVLRRGLALRLTCSEACTVQLTARLDARTARRLHLSRVAGTSSVALRGNSASPVRVRFNRRAVKALRTQRTVTVAVTAVATDPAGNRQTQRRTVKVRR